MRTSGLIIWLFWCMTSTGVAVEVPPTFPPPRLSQALIGGWLVTGPFETGNPAASILPDEAGLAPAIGDRVTWKGRSYPWRPHPGGFLELAVHFALPKFSPSAMAYAVSTFRSPLEGPYVLALGADDAAQAWWNGEPVVRQGQLGSLVPDQIQALVWVKKGDNRLILRSFNNWGLWRTAARLLPPGGSMLMVAAELDLAGVLVNGEQLSTSTLGSRLPPGATPPAPRRTLPLVSLIPDSPLPPLRIEVKDHRGRIVFQDRVNGYAGQWTVLLPPDAIGQGTAEIGPADWSPGDPETLGRLGTAGWTVRVSGDGAEGFEPFDVRRRLRQRIPIIVRGDRHLEIEAVSAATHRPIANASVEVGAPWNFGLFIEGRTDGGGRCRFEGLPPGVVQVRVGAPDCAPWHEYVFLESGPRPTRIEAGLNDGAPITHTASLQFDDGTALAGARVRWASHLEPGLFVDADERGAFALRGVEGSVPLTIEWGAFSSWLTRVWAERRAPPHSLITLARRPVVGVVTGMAGEPVENAAVMIRTIGREQDAGTLTGAGGRVALEYSLTGPVVLTVWTPDAAGFWTLPTAEGGARRQDAHWTLGGGRRVRGRVVARDGTPLEGLRVVVTADAPKAAPRFETATWADGRFWIGPLMPRRSLRLSVMGVVDGHERELASRSTGNDDEQLPALDNLVIESPVSQRWRFRACDARTSAPVAAQVSLVGLDDRAPVRRLAAAVGHFVFRRVGPGVAEVSLDWPPGRDSVSTLLTLDVQAPGYAPGRWSLIEAAAIPPDTAGFRPLALDPVP
ncbi:MAG: hypothetical protein Kow0059_08480 [Candidatus Sumerlaeia bacterium]